MVKEELGCICGLDLGRCLKHFPIPVVTSVYWERKRVHEGKKVNWYRRRVPYGRWQFMGCLGNKVKRKTKAWTARKLYLEAERLWKSYCLKRDGERCMVFKTFPELKVPHTVVYQVDHFVSRQNKNLFFDVRNGTTVCSACNSAKSWGRYKSVDLAINEIVLRREGPKAVEEMVNKTGPCRDWKKVYMLEKIVADLKQRHEELDGGKVEIPKEATNG